MDGPKSTWRERREPAWERKDGSVLPFSSAKPFVGAAKREAQGCGSGAAFLPSPFSSPPSQLRADGALSSRCNRGGFGGACAEGSVKACGPPMTGKEMAFLRRGDEVSEDGCSHPEMVAVLENSNGAASGLSLSESKLPSVLGRR